MSEQEQREWVESRYGPITLQQRTVLFPAQASVAIYIAAVPVMGGIATGAGATQADAINYLCMDLRAELRAHDVPLIRGSTPMTQPKGKTDVRHCLNPIAQQLTECGLPSVTVVIDEARTTCEQCRDRSIERRISAYFRRYGLDRKYSRQAK